MSHAATSPTHAKTGEGPGVAKTPVTHVADDAGKDDDNSASGLIESPVTPGHGKLEKHDFADGGGSGGAEAFRRRDR